MMNFKIKLNKSNNELILYGSGELRILATRNSIQNRVIRTKETKLRNSALCRSLSRP